MGDEGTEGLRCGREREENEYSNHLQLEFGDILCRSILKNT